MSKPVINDKYDNRTHLEQIVWDMRLADLPRGGQRAILNRLYNGDPPFPEATAEENNIQVNRNDLTGVNMLTQGRRQWMQAMLRPGNNFSVTYDSGPKLKRQEAGHKVSKKAATVLKKSREYIEQSRAAGGQMLLHGVGPCTWRTRQSVVPRPVPISSVMIPSETEIDWDNLPHFAMFQEWTAHQLARMVYGPKRDPGWNERLVQAQWSYVRDQVMKQPNATAFQYMPERIEELIKQDGAMWGSDAIPTIDVWDCYIRADDESSGWYRRIFLDWGIAETDTAANKAPTPNRGDRPGANEFLYTSGKRKYAKHINEILHCQFGDCSAVFPQRYHSIRSLGWMLWGICDLENMLHCKFTESLFEQMMWFFRAASNADLVRLKKADFYHYGVIPQGIDWVKSNERFTPNAEIVQMGFGRFQKLIADNASSFTQDFDAGRGQKEMTATETMARVNSINALVSGLLTLAYTYEEFKDAEIMRRLCIKGSRDPLAQKFQKLCMEDDVDMEWLDSDRMIVTRERSLGAGNKTLEMAIVNFLQQIRKNLGPAAQRRIDYISVETATDDAALAAELAPIDDKSKITRSMHDAELSTDRLMRGLPYPETPEMVYGDYVHVWMTDFALMVAQITQTGGMAKPEDIAGFTNLAQHIEKFLGIMGQNEEDKPVVTEYKKALTSLMNHVKAFEQRLAQQMKAAQKNGQQGGIDGKTIGQIKAAEILAQTKAKLQEERSAQRMAQDQARFEMDEQRKERGHKTELRRTGLEHYFDLLADLNGQMTKQNREPAGNENQ